MAVEVDISSAEGPISVEELTAVAKAKQLCIRFPDGEGMPLDSRPAGPMLGHFVVIGWADAHTETTAAVDAAIETRDKGALDRLGHAGKLVWCGLVCRAFSYQQFWAKYPREIAEYEASIDPGKLVKIRAARTRYTLRSAVRPEQCARFADALGGMIKRASGGVVE
ncbi:MAG TPA: hypothetical protein VH475_07155 [Tepidisphaeraceae bacterium]|jgi:hypothetical protein